MSKYQKFFSKEELWLLFSRLGPGFVIGFQDPTLGLLSNEISVINKTAYQSLINRGIIERVNENYQIEQNYHKLIETIIRPDHSIIIAIRTKDFGMKINSYYYGHNIIANLMTCDLENFQLNIRKEDEILSDLYESFDIITCENIEDGFILSEDTIQQVRGNCHLSDSDQGYQTLLKAGLSTKQAFKFSPVLSSPDINFSIIAYRNINNRMSINGFTVLGSKSHLWLLDPIDDQSLSVKISQISKDAFEEKISCLLP